MFPTARYVLLGRATTLYASWRRASPQLPTPQRLRHPHHIWDTAAGDIDMAVSRATKGDVCMDGEAAGSAAELEGEDEEIW